MAVKPASVKSINRSSKTVELEDGRVLPLPDDLAFEFFGSKAAKQKKEHMAQAVQDVQSATSALPGGQTAGAFASSFGESSIFPRLANNFLDYAGQSIASIRKGEGQENMGFFERLGENVSALRAGRREGRARIAQENPGATKAGALSGLAADILTPIKGLPKNPIAQGATLGALYSSGSDKNVLEDPLGVAKEIGVGAGLGAGIGAIGSRLSNVAQQRGALRTHPGQVAQHAQQTAQAEQNFLNKMNRGLDTVQREIRGAGIPKEALAVDEFVNRNIGLSPLAATQEGRGLSAFLKAVEDAAPNSLNAAELKSIFSAVEGRLAGASAAEQGVLNAFRQHLVDRLPLGAANAAAKYKYGTRLLNVFDREVDSAVSSFLSDKKMVQDLKKFVGNAPVDNLAGDIKRFVKSGYDKISPSEFINDLSSGNFKDRLLWFFDNNQKVKELTQKVESTLSNLQNVAPIAQLRSPEIQNLVKARDALQAMRAGIDKNLTRRISQNVNPATTYTADVAKNVGDKISHAVGLPAGRATSATNVRPVVTPPPGAPQVGKVAEFFETPNFYRTQAGKLFNLRGKSGLAKVGALAIGGAKLKLGAGVATGAAGLTAALRGATSPTALGAFARTGIQRGGIRLVVESIASSYPSYENGVLTDPEDRRMAAAQIEQDQDLSLEDKAMLQTKINRGVNLETLLRDEDYAYGN